MNIEHSTVQRLEVFNTLNVEVFIKREDQIHHFISGNKYRKLKYNLKVAKELGYSTILTFGGAFSNHIAAVAAAGYLQGFKTIGIIRGEELRDKTQHNDTLTFAKSQGMQLSFVSREAYRAKTSKVFIDALKQQFGKFYLIPEGGTNTLAVKGCEEILSLKDQNFDFVCCPVGTGGTIAGLINASKTHQKILGFSALKNNVLTSNISKFVTQSNWSLINDFHFGGYAKVNQELIAFLNAFNVEYNIPLDPIYTGKMMFGIFEMIKKGLFFKNAKVLAIHTGGLQGIAGINSKLKKKGLPLITYYK